MNDKKNPFNEIIHSSNYNNYNAAPLYIIMIIIISLNMYTSSWSVNR